ncbi:MAG: ATP-binding cassette domain-containing protein [Alphaproteobacteria bacterium]
MSTQTPLIRLSDVHLRHSDKDLFKGVTLSLFARDRICLVGRNGTGKSTLLRILGAQADFDRGELFVQPGTRVGILPQEPDLSGFPSVLDYATSEGAEPHRAKMFLDSLKLEPEQQTEGLSGGEQRRAALAKALAEQPDVLLLDEPTNHLDVDTIEWLEAEIRRYEGAILTISHDRRFLETVTEQVTWLDRGQVWHLNKNYRHFDAWAEKMLEDEARDVAKLNKLIAEETQWSREGISARRTRNMGRMRRLEDLRQERRNLVARPGQVQLESTSSGQSGRRVIEATDIAKSYGDRAIIAPFSTKIMRGDRVGIIGPNGAGKSTLIKMLLGHLEPDSGSVFRGTNLEPLVLDQMRTTLKPGTTVWDYLADMGGDQIVVRGQPRHVVSYMRDFLFSERAARAPVDSLSGGERNRLTLAKGLANPSNLLVLDEPTNDLDLETLDLLQEIIADYDGTVLLVSHDRDFIDRLVTSTILFDGFGGVYEYPGGYSDARRQHQTRLKDQAAASKAKTARKEPAKKAEATAPSKKNRLTYAEQIRLDKLPGEMEALETNIAKGESLLTDPELYARDPDKFGRITGKLAELREKLEAAELEWLDLEERAEG